MKRASEGSQKAGVFHRSVSALRLSGIALLFSVGVAAAQDAQLPIPVPEGQDRTAELLPHSFAVLQKNGVALKLEAGKAESQSYPDRGSLSGWDKVSWILSGTPPEVLPRLEKPLAASGAATPISGVQLLWSSASTLWPSKVLQLELDVFWGTLGDPNNYSIGGRLVRIYPHAISDTNKTVQVFRERFDVTAPAAVSGYSLLSYRFFGDTPDMLWVRSAAIEDTRQLFEENRASSSLGSVVGLDDLFTWSGKIEREEILGIRSRQLLLPEPHTVSRVGQGDGCYGARLDAAVPLSATNNLTTLQWPLVPTEVLEILLGSNSDRATTGKTVLYLEKGTLSPILKEIYDENNVLHKAVASRLAVFSGGSGSALLGLESVAFREDEGGLAVSSITSSRVLECSKIPKEFQPPFFSPATLGSS